MKNKAFSITAILIINIFSVSLYAQYSGGQGCGFAFNTSVAQQISQTVYNDLSVTEVVSPTHPDSLPHNTVIYTEFTLHNMGTYPVFPVHGLFPEIFVNQTAVIQATYFLADTLEPGSSVNIVISDSIVLADTGLFEICVEVNGSTFAADTVTDNNRACAHIYIYDATNINMSAPDAIDIFYLKNKKQIFVKGVNNVLRFEIFDLSGRVMNTINNTNPNAKTHYLNAYNLNNGIYILRIETKERNHSIKLYIDK